MIEKSNLNDVSFLFVIKADAIIRLENLFAVVEFLSSNFNTHILVLEAGKYNNNIVSRNLADLANYIFIEDYDPIFYRTHYINLLVNKCKTPYLAVWDTDVIIPQNQIVESINLLRNDEAEFVYPYELNFLDTTEIIREYYMKEKNITVLQSNEDKMIKMYKPNPSGGCFFAKRDSYIESGIENKNFYGWGVEDGERIGRWISLGYRYKRVPGSLYHLTHKRGINSTIHNKNQGNIKRSEINRIWAMSKKELQAEVKKWKNNI